MIIYSVFVGLIDSISKIQAICESIIITCEFLNSFLFELKKLTWFSFKNAKDLSNTNIIIIVLLCWEDTFK